MAKITQKLHPIVTHCWAAGDITYEHFYDIIVLQNGYDPKTYVMNFVYNFGLIFDAGREVYLFFKEDPRGQLNNIHDTGFNIGLIAYLVITPGLADYEGGTEKSEAMLEAEARLKADLDRLLNIDKISESVQNIANGDDEES